TSAVVGTEGGAVMKCRMGASTKGSVGQSKSMRWSPEADDMLSRVPTKHQRQVAGDIEKAARACRGTEVDLPTVFRARVDPSLLYPSPGLFRMEKHHGPVHSINCSPFHRQGALRNRPHVREALLLTSGADGSARLYNTLQSRAVLTFEPSSSNLMDVKWSRARPLVFAAVAEDGGIFIYDLLQSPVVPVASAKLPRGQDADQSSRPSRLVDVSGGKGGAPAYAVAFNPRQRDLLATGDGHGRVIVWRMSWRLANKRPGEDAGLERLFKGSVGD
ncbi:unnamed protein product, partial [Hapterophycus canaliculatus]